MNVKRTDRGITIELTANEYEEMREDYCGVCLNCGEVAWDGCEPDIRKGMCESCEIPAVMGIEEMLLEGRVQIIP